MSRVHFIMDVAKTVMILILSTVLIFHYRAAQELLAANAELRQADERLKRADDQLQKESLRLLRACSVNGGEI